MDGSLGGGNDRYGLPVTEIEPVAMIARAFGDFAEPGLPEIDTVPAT